MNKLNLFLILISSIIFSLLTKVVEGACNYNFDENTSKGKEQKKLFCNNSQIGSTQLRQKNFLTKMGNLVSLVTKTQKQVFLNQKNIAQNAKNNKALKTAMDPDGEEDTSDACKQYPEAC